jgi:hypothetical protein
MQNIRLTEEARQDLLSGKAFYDGLQPGVGSWFFDSLISDIESLCIYAGVHERHFGTYRLLARRFPYAIYYQLDDSNITVVAVLPMRRSPTWLQQQLGKSGQDER